MGAFLFWAHRRGIRTRKGAELRKREAFTNAAREGRRPEAEAGGEMDPWRIPVCKKMPNMSTATFLIAAFSKS